MSARIGVAALTAVLACAEAPTPLSIYGIWLHTSDGVHRAYEFAPTSDARPELIDQVLVYVLRRYPVGQSPAIVEVGLYDLAPSSGTSRLTTTVLWDETGTRAGHAFRIDLEDWDGDALTMRDGRLGALRFSRVAALPGSEGPEIPHEVGAGVEKRGDRPRAEQTDDPR